MTLPPQTQLGRYQIRSLLGAGGMGEVYLAQDTSLNRKVALKVLPADLASNGDRMRRFKQESFASKLRNHSWTQSVQGAVATWSVINMRYFLTDSRHASLTRSLPLPVLTVSNHEI